MTVENLNKWAKQVFAKENQQPRMEYMSVETLEFIYQELGRDKFLKQINNSSIMTGQAGVDFIRDVMKQSK
jgi:hypothetical protein